MPLESVLMIEIKNSTSIIGIAMYVVFHLDTTDFAGWSRHLDTDCYSNDIPGATVNILECVLLCIQHASCVAIVHHPATEKCHLKRACTILAELPGFNTYRYIGK